MMMRRVIYVSYRMQHLNTITESTPILYHSTSISALSAITRDDRIELTFSGGTNADNLHSTKWFYLACSHSKVGGYMQHIYKYSATLVLDGNALGQRYTIKPCQYWGDMKGFTVDQRIKADENEERVWAHTSTIKPASLYVKAAHVLYKLDVGQEFPAIATELAELSNSPWPVYYYTEKQAFMVQDIRKAVTSPIIGDIKEWEPYTRSDPDRDARDLNIIMDWIDDPNSEDEKVKELAHKRAYHFDFHSSVECDVHNIRSRKTASAQAALQRLAGLMRKYKVKSVKELVLNAQARMK